MIERNDDDKGNVMKQTRHTHTILFFLDNQEKRK